MIRAVLVVFNILICSTIYAQSSNDVAQNKSVVWLGVDYSYVKCIGEFRHFGASDNLKNNLLNPLNKIVLEEHSKFNLNKFFHTTQVKISIDKADEINKLLPADSLIILPTSNVAFTKKASIENHLRFYANGGRTEMAVLLLPEIFDAYTKKATIVYVLLDLNNGKAIHLGRFTTKGSGKKGKNYWANTIYSTLKFMGRRWKYWSEKDI